MSPRLQHLTVWFGIVVSCFGRPPESHRFDYSSNVGLVVYRSGANCLAINNAQVESGAQVSVVLLSRRQIVRKAVVLRSAKDVCGSIFDQDETSNYYQLQMDG